MSSAAIFVSTGLLENMYLGVIHIVSTSEITCCHWYWNDSSNRCECTLYHLIDFILELLNCPVSTCIWLLNCCLLKSVYVFWYCTHFNVGTFLVPYKNTFIVAYIWWIWCFYNWWGSVVNCLSTIALIHFNIFYSAKRHFFCYNHYSVSPSTLRDRLE